jgi:DnaJ-class molecular chaperone
MAKIISKRTVVECPKCEGAGFKVYALQGDPDRLVDIGCEVCEGTGSLELTDITEAL